MSKSALLDLVPEERRKIIYHEEDGKTYSEIRQDIDPIVQAAKDMWCDNPPLDMRRVALIPKAVLDRAFLEGWFHDENAWRKWANGEAIAAGLRTCKGTI